MKTEDPLNIPLLARMSLAAPETALGEFMFMPGGEHTIYCHKGLGAKRTEVAVHVQVDGSSAAALQHQLQAIQARSAHRPFLDFNHDDAEASFWPIAFAWKQEPSPGVYVRGEWSSAGKAAIEGKTFRAFSPVFHVDDDQARPARVVCNPGAGLNFGGLVNKPAFTENLPFWAKQAMPDHHQTPIINMTTEELASLKAKLQSLESEIAGLKAKASSDQTVQSALAAKQTEAQLAQEKISNGELSAKVTHLETERAKRIEADADAAITAAVTRGAIPAQDDAIKGQWKKTILADAANIALLASLAGNPALAVNQPLAGSSNRLTPSVRITREETAIVLKAMDAIYAKQTPAVPYEQKRNLAREFAVMYAKEITPRLKEGDDIPLAGANAFGTLAVTMASVRTLELLTIALPILGQVWTDFSDQIVSYGDTLKTRVVGIPTVQTYNQGTGWTASDMTTTDVSMTYDQFKGVPITIDQQTIAGTVRRLFDEIAPAQAFALGKAMVDNLYTRITAANFPGVALAVSSTGAAIATIAAGLATFGRSTLVDLGGALDDQGNPENGRFCVLNRLYYNALEKDPTVISLAVYQQPQIVGTGNLPMIEGFNPIKAPNLPATAIGGQTLKGFGGSRSALVLASRLSADYMNVLPGAANGTLTVVSTPAGFSANQVQFVDNKLGTANQRLEAIFSTAAGQANAGQILTDV